MGQVDVAGAAAAQLRPRGSLRFACAIVTCLGAASCAKAPLLEGGSLSSYDGLATDNGMLTDARLRVNKEQVLAAKTVRIVPTEFASSADTQLLSEQQRKLVANVVDRALCAGLGERFTVVSLTDPADLTVHAVLTNFTLTNRAAAGVSKVAGFVPMLLSASVPVPRIPIGLGSLSVEAEARDSDGVQQAAMLWGKGANSLTNQATISKIGDAYQLARSFGGDFSRMLVTGSSPFEGGPKLPSLRSARQNRNPVCDVFGKGPGVAGFAGRAIGLSPEMTDKGAAPGI